MFQRPWSTLFQILLPFFSVQTIKKAIGMIFTCGLIMIAQQYLQLFLKDKWQEMRLRNNSISLRAFAKRIGTPSSALSEFLRGKRNFSLELALKIAENLSLSKNDIKLIEDKYSQEMATNSINIHPYSKQELQLQGDQYELVADPIYYSLLCLLETKNFNPNLKWISQRLGLTTTKIKKGLAVLKRLNLVTESHGNLIPTDKSLQTTEDITNASLKKRHVENLESAKNAIYLHDVLERDFCFMTMAIDPSKLPKAKKMIREFRNQLCAFLESGEKSEVYEMCIQLFPKTSKPKPHLTYKKRTKGKL